MGQNSTEVAYGFGQMGSAFTDTGDPIYAPYGKVIATKTFVVLFTLLAGVESESRPPMRVTALVPLTCILPICPKP